MDATEWLDRSDVLDPPIPSVYRVRDAHGAIIYVGKTVQSIEVRFLGHRTQQDSPAWLAHAARVEVRPVGAEQVHAAEAAEIHRHHPIHNKQCVLCGRSTLNAPPLLTLWRRLVRRHAFPLHEPWRNYDTFAKEVIDLLGERPQGAEFRLINPDGRYEPGNVHWRIPKTKRGH